jgi:Ca-activated chloride channel family protein
MAPTRTTTLSLPLSLVLALPLLGAACSSGEVDSIASDEVSESSENLGDASSGGVDTESAASETASDAAPAPASGPAVAERAFGEEEAADAEVGDDRDENNTFADYGARPFVDTAVDPLSTFALDVDTASYAVARSWLSEGSLPPAESVRVEEYVNSFDYDYPVPDDGLALSAEAGPSPYNGENVLVRVGVQAEEVANAERPAASLTFVIDTSGSMDRTDRLELVKTSLIRLVTELDSDDSVAVVTYSDDAEVILPPTAVAEEQVILDAIDALAPTGSTNLEAGLRRGYDLAADAFVEGGINRVVLASDGVANVGLIDPDGLVELIRDDADRGVQLITVGVGMGNFNDVTMEQLANDGDGFYAYVDTEAEAQELFADDLVSTLLTVAFDAKIQVEWNAETVASYRLLGFENRAVLDEDFRNDDVDAGELGAGHQVTALYELTLHGDVAAPDRLGAVQLRWADPDDGDARETSLTLDGELLEAQWSATSEDFRLAVTTAAFAEVLRESPHVGDLTLAEVSTEAGALSSGSGPIEELRNLVDEARDLGA